MKVGDPETVGEKEKNIKMLNYICLLPKMNVDIIYSRSIPLLPLLLLTTIIKLNDTFLA